MTAKTFSIPLVSQAALVLLCITCWEQYEADTKTLSCRCRLFLLLGQDLCTPIDQQWYLYQVIEKQKKPIGMLRRREHARERVLVSAS